MGSPFGIWTMLIGVHVLMIGMVIAGWIFYKKNKDLF
ncbi:hypothetical protein SK3146_00107 [Paenibacillus konkukensis]|uniref:LPXTG cell wall anchor domain-containing protein n=1 Tax=Paenibacillus konkukensis TaxID=2020716 RepID=A0ABY4RG50_9BACL|nr:hypothetical protein SK3146_00107 [Paenibacillus konkukensis]